MSYNVAVVGATGNVGREILNILDERNFPIKNLYALASSKSIGLELSYGEDDKRIKVDNLANFDFKKIDIALFSPGSKVSSVYAPKAAKAGTIVIDNTSYFRMDPAVPLIIPEVNSDALGGYRSKGIIANPNCAIMQLALVLKPLHDKFKVKRVVVSTYQSVSGAGKKAMDELYNQTKGKYVFHEVIPKVFHEQIAFNVIPQIDDFLEDGSTKEEWKMVNEIKKIIDSSIKLTATCVRVPVFVGHSMAVNVEFAKVFSEEEARDILSTSKGIIVVDKRQAGGYVTPIHVVKTDDVFVSRIRKDQTLENGLNMWVVSDNLRKGAALNAVQIAEMLVEKYLKR